MIPKIIWQTHEKKHNELFTFQKNITGTWKNINSGWEYRYVDAIQRSEEVKKYSSTLYKYYNLVDNIHKSDIWRLVALYNHGGFYADMDSVCIMPIDEILKRNYSGQELICSPIGFQHSGIGNSNFGVIKNSEIIKSIIDSIMLQYSKMEIEDFKKLVFAFPENYIFSEITTNNASKIFFTNEYYSHSKDYKESFDARSHNVTINGENFNYDVFCEINNFFLYI